MGPSKGLCCTIYQRRNCDKNWDKIGGFRYPGIAQYGLSQLLLNEGLGDEGIGSVMCKFTDHCPNP